MKDQILCAIDFSESSVQALKWASRLGKINNSDVAALYSYRLLQTGKLDDIVSFRKKTEEDARKKFGELKKAAFDPTAPVAITFITEIGFYSDTIENFIRKNPQTIVVLSEEMAHTIYDHKAQSLIHFLKSLHVPLLIVPDREQKSDLKTTQITTGKIAM